MTDLSHETEEPKHKEYRLGEWFTPLTELIQFPPEEGDNPEHRQWYYPFSIKGVGKFQIDITHSVELNESLKNPNHGPIHIEDLLILPDKIEVISDSNIKDWEQELEVPILRCEGIDFIPYSTFSNIDFPLDRENSTSSLLYVEIKPPSGNTIHLPITNTGSGDHPLGVLRPIQNGRLLDGVMLFPEGRLILENTHFRVVEE